MDGLAILSRPHAFRFLVELNGGPLKESDLGRVTGNYYTAHNMLVALEEAGLYLYHFPFPVLNRPPPMEGQPTGPCVPGVGPDLGLSGGIAYAAGIR